MQRLMSQDKLRAKDLFDRLDARGRGHLLLKDFERSLEWIGLSMPSMELRQLFNHIDHNKDSRIDSDEFKRDIKYKYNKSHHDYHGPEGHVVPAQRGAGPQRGVCRELL